MAGMRVEEPRLVGCCGLSGSDPHVLLARIRGECVEWASVRRGWRVCCERDGFFNFYIFIAILSCIC